MVQCTSNVLESYFYDYGWNFKSSGIRQWITGWRGEDRYFPLNISLTDTLISFSIQPFLKLQVDWESWPEISKLLLELNNECKMIKISIDPEYNMCLSMELPSSSLTFGCFKDSIGMLGYYADHVYDAILTFLDQLGFKYADSLNMLT